MVPILSHYNPKLPIVVETDASNFVIGISLSQKEESVWLIALYSRKMIVIELNYDIYNIEILAIVSAFPE
jgi:hypothetical protein